MRALVRPRDAHVSNLLKLRVILAQDQEQGAYGDVCRCECDVIANKPHSRGEQEEHPGNLVEEALAGSFHAWIGSPASG
jgi:hypothetical protein